MAGLFGELFGKKDKSVSVDDLITRLDTAIDNLHIKSDINVPTEDSLITKSITDVLVPEDNGKESGSELDSLTGKFQTAGLDPLFKDLAVPDERLKKYKTYDSIYSNVQIIKKVVSTYLDNIFQKDSISNKVLLIKEVDKDKSSGEIDEYKKFAERFIEFFNMDERLRNLVFKSLKYGDSYIEYIKLDDIPDNFPKVKPEEVSKINRGSIDDQTSSFLNSSFVSESSDLEMIRESVNSKYSSSSNNGKFILDELDIDKLSNMLFEFSSVDEQIENSDLVFKYEAKDNLSDSSTEKANTKKRSKGKKSDPIKGSNLNGIVLRYHDPHRVIPLISEYDNILGYVELKSIEKKGTTAFNPVMGFVDIIKKVSNLKGSGGGDRTAYEKTIQTFSHTIAKKIIAKYKIFYDDSKVDVSKKKQLEEEYNKLIKNNLDDEIYYSLKRILLDTGVNSLFYKKLQVRFIPVESMFKFPVSNSSTYPFGESIIDPLVYPAKLYLLTQLSNIVTKLSRSSIIRKWTVDVGSRENESDIFNRLKKQIRNQKITASDLTSSKEIPRLLSDFRDFVTFTKKGQRFVDVETLKFSVVI
jgi:hypothetical protein